jgi:hypothetical protein
VLPPATILAPFPLPIPLTVGGTPVPAPPGTTVPPVGPLPTEPSSTLLTLIDAELQQILPPSLLPLLTLPIYDLPTAISAALSGLGLPGLPITIPPTLGPPPSSIALPPLPGGVTVTVTVVVLGNTLEISLPILSVPLPNLPVPPVFPVLGPGPPIVPLPGVMLPPLPVVTSNFIDVAGVIAGVVTTATTLTAEAFAPVIGSSAVVTVAGL